jgi:lipopolysaccharide transport system ATP-binding protein
MKDAIVVEHISKQFKRLSVSGSTTLKEAVLKGGIFQAGSSAGHFEALHDVSFSVPEGTVLGIVGPNGAGKSTMLRLLAGIYRPTSGHIDITGRVSALLSLGLGFHPEFSGRENIVISGLALGLSRRRVDEITEDIFRFAELENFIDAPMRTYSSGMFMRLAFSVAVNVDPDILLCDEVLAVGDAAFAKKSRARIEEFRDRGKTIVLATHDLQTVATWCQQALLLENGRVTCYGDPEKVVARYREIAFMKPQ